MPEWTVGWWKDGMPQRASSDWAWPGRGLAFEVGARVWLALTVRPSPQPTAPLPADPAPAAPSATSLFGNAQ